MLGTISEIKLKVVREKLSEQIADLLEDIILNEELENNEKLPPEQSLAEQFDVSKNVIRESLNILKERGLVENRNGIGNYVTKPGAEHLSDVIERMIALGDIDYRQIYETRIILETSACREASQKITLKEIDRLEQLMKQLENKALPIQERREVDFSFHIVIAEASGNNLLVVLIQAMKNIIQGSMFLKEDIERWDSINEAFQSHRHILDALIAHNTDEAEAAMYDHLCTSIKNVERSIQYKS